MIMNRKVVKHGPSTLIISLPSTWVTKNGVKKGDEVEVKENGETLLISSHSGNQIHLQISEDFTGLEPRIVELFLGRVYAEGYDQVFIIHNNVKMLDIIQQKVNELMGFEIIEQNEKSCTIQSVSTHLEFDFDNSLRRAFLLIKQIMEECIEGYKKKDLVALEHLYLKDLEVNRLCSFCLRQLNKQQYHPHNTQQMHSLYYIIEQLEHFADDFKKLGKILAATKQKRESIAKTLQLIAEQFDNSYSFFYKATKEKANKSYLIYREISQMLRELSADKLTSEEILAVQYMRIATKIAKEIAVMRLDFLRTNQMELPFFQ